VPGRDAIESAGAGGNLRPAVMRARLLILVVVLAALAVVAVALARTLSSPVSVKETPIEAGSPAALALNTSFGQSTHGELSSLELDLARGFHFDPRAAAICSDSQALAGTCPLASVIGHGTGRILVQGPYLPRTQYAVGATFYLSPPRHPGDVAGLVFDMYEPESELQAILLGRVVPLAHGPYGLALRFSNTARELPSAYQLTLVNLQTLLQAQRTTTSSTYHLLTNPRSCRRAGWPVRLSIQSAAQTLVFSSDASCQK
jgi:hypothetical protein